VLFRSLEDNSSIICLSLGATRDFILCDNDDCGKFIREELNIRREWSVGNGDLYVLGPETNLKYCHVVPKDSTVRNARISVICRTVDKSFIDLQAEPKTVTYANGTSRTLYGECISCKGFEDSGSREHIAELVLKREQRKLAKSGKASDTRVAQPVSVPVQPVPVQPVPANAPSPSSPSTTSTFTSPTASISATTIPPPAVGTNGTDTAAIGASSAVSVPQSCTSMSKSADMKKFYMGEALTTQLMSS